MIFPLAEDGAGSFVMNASRKAGVGTERGYFIEADSKRQHDQDD
jgi:hypothetical protein